MKKMLTYGAFVFVFCNDSPSIPGSIEKFRSEAQKVIKMQRAFFDGINIDNIKSEALFNDTDTDLSEVGDKVVWHILKNYKAWNKIVVRKFTIFSNSNTNNSIVIKFTGDSFKIEGSKKTIKSLYRVSDIFRMNIFIVDNNSSRVPAYCILDCILGSNDGILCKQNDSSFIAGRLSYFSGELSVRYHSDILLFVLKNIELLSEFTPEVANSYITVDAIESESEDKLKLSELTPEVANSYITVDAIESESEDKLKLSELTPEVADSNITVDAIESKSENKFKLIYYISDYFNIVNLISNFFYFMIKSFLWLNDIYERLYDHKHIDSLDKPLITWQFQSEEDLFFSNLKTHIDEGLKVVKNNYIDSIPLITWLFQSEEDLFFSKFKKHIGESFENIKNERVFKEYYSGREMNALTDLGHELFLFIINNYKEWNKIVGKRFIKDDNLQLEDCVIVIARSFKSGFLEIKRGELLSKVEDFLKLPVFISTDLSISPIHSIFSYCNNLIDSLKEDKSQLELSLRKRLNPYKLLQGVNDKSQIDVYNFILEVFFYCNSVISKVKLGNFKEELELENLDNMRSKADLIMNNFNNTDVEVYLLESAFRLYKKFLYIESKVKVDLEAD